MALITGSTTTDWSTVALPSSQNFQQQFADFGSTVNHVFTEINAGHFTFNGPHSSTFVSLTLTTGDQETVTATGSGFFQLNLDPVIKTFIYDNPVTHETMQFSGTIDFVGNEVVNRLTVGTPGSTATIIGNVILDPQGHIVSGNVTEVRETIGSTEVSVKGSLVLSNAGDISGTVSQISVQSGTDTMLMSGLSVPFSAIDTVATVNDLFSAVGNQMAGNDTITYTNNSGVGMSFVGGAGNDTITISGPNGDTLDGGAGNDVFVIGNASDHGAGEIITGGAGNDVIRFTSTTPDQTLVLAPGVTQVEGVTISTAAGLTTGTTPLNVDASAVGSGLSITGNAGVNSLTGTAFDDVLAGNAGNDELEGEDGNDTLIGGLGNDTLVGGVGDDTYVIGQGTDVLTENLNEGTDTVQSSITYTLGANFENLTLTGVGHQRHRQ